MMIKDLEKSKDLDRDALSAVRGGRDSIEQGGVYAPVANIHTGQRTFGCLQRQRPASEAR